LLSMPQLRQGRDLHLSDPVAANLARLETHKHSAQHDGGRSKDFASAEVLAHHTDSDRCRERTFKVQQQRSGQRRQAVETEKHQDRPDDTTKENDAADRGEIAASDLRFAGLER
jgi:hypothetical protein